MNRSSTAKTSDTIFQEYPDILTVPELAKMLRIGRNTAYDMVNGGKIPFVKVGTQIRIPKSSVLDFISQCHNNRCYQIAI